MDSLDSRKRSDVCLEQSTLIIQQSSLDDDRNGYISDPVPKLLAEDEDDRKYFTVCAENKINALIERVREFHDNFDRPDEIENEAVSMAIQQHGLRKNSSEDISYGRGDGPNDINIRTLQMSDSDKPTISRGCLPKTFTEEGNYGIRNDEERKSKRKKHSTTQCSNNDGSIQYEVSSFDAIYFLNEAVAAAIEQKGLCSSSFDIK